MEESNILPQSPVTETSEQLFTNQIITASNGVELVADLYVPAGKPPFPAIVQITPYGAQQLATAGEIYATRGYLFLAVDARGRYRSAGEWEPMANDQADGHSVINWIAGHTLCNGRVGTRGHSYSAYNQLLGAIDAPPALQAMVVCSAPGDPLENAPFQGGAFDINNFLWLLNMSGRTNQKTFDAEDFSIKRFGADLDALVENPYAESKDEDKEEDKDKDKGGEEGKDVSKQQQQKKEALLAAIDTALMARPFKDLDLRFGTRLNLFREWLEHWQQDEYWQLRSVSQRLDRTAVATLHISGWWDRNVRGTARCYHGMQEQAASHAARQKQRLLIGPWNHELKAPDCSALPEEEARQILRAARHDEFNDEFAWFDQHLMDIEPGPSTRARVRLFVTGLYRWLEFDDWPPAGSQADSYFPGADNNEDGPGRLLPVSVEGGRTESVYRFDPQHPTPFSEATIPAEPAPFDNRHLEQTRDDMLLFDMEPIQAPLALAGESSLIVFAHADVPDFDLYARLLDVHPDGRAIYLCDGIIRARFRKGRQHAQAVVAGEISSYQIDLGPLGHVLRVGHYLRLELASSAFRRFDINACSGGNLAEETTAQQATISIVHSASHPSRLILPVCTDPRLVAGLVAGLADQ